MSEALTFFGSPELEPSTPHEDLHRGLLTSADIKVLLERGSIRSNTPITPEQIQPASLDLRLGTRGFVLPASFLPGRTSSAEEKAKSLTKEAFTLNSEGLALEPNKIYLIELAERLNLPNTTTAFASPKSSTGRLDVFTRLIGDYNNYYDSLPAGYKGSLWLEIAPRSFGIIVREGSKLLQLRFRRGGAAFANSALHTLHKEQGIIAQNEHLTLKQGLTLSVDLTGDICGYQAKATEQYIDVDKVGAYKKEDFWQPIKAPADRRLILEPDAFYILASREKVRIPPTHAAEMVAFDSQIGEFRAHYAGFFDSGFGYHSQGAKAVLEMRVRDTAFLLEHQQIVGRLVFERLKQKTELHYDERKNANYQGQGLKLSKHFV